MKALVAYFSASGVTERAAKFLADSVGADIYEIKPEVRYSPEDLNWRNDKSRSSIEMKNKSFRPAIVKGDVNVTPYDVVFLGFPIWWYVAPTIINSFLESQDFSGKTIALFATSGGSGLGRTAAELKVSLPENATIVEGKLLNGRLSKESLVAWGADLGL